MDGLCVCRCEDTSLAPVTNRSVLAELIFSWVACTEEGVEVGALCMRCVCARGQVAGRLAGSLILSSPHFAWMKQAVGQWSGVTST